MTNEEIKKRFRFDLETKFIYSTDNVNQYFKFYKDGYYFSIKDENFNKIVKFFFLLKNLNGSNVFHYYFLNNSTYYYSHKEILDRLFSLKTERDVKKFCKSNMRWKKEELYYCSLDMKDKISKKNNFYTRTELDVYGNFMNCNNFILNKIPDYVSYWCLDR